jgi:ADP-ribose pyrophosphatase YjhB (NUDIX family)
MGFKYLISRRSFQRKAFPGMWTVPGGGLTIDDYINTKPTVSGSKQWYGALIKSLHREVKEEVGVKVGHPELLVDLTFIRSDNIPVIILSFFAKYVSGKVVFEKDVESATIDARWVTLKEAKKYDLIDGIWGELRDVEKILKSRL